VGRGGRIDPADVQVVQEALNRRLDAGLTVNGKCDAKTLGAIEDFQKAMGQRRPSGVIEPGRGPARALTGSGKLPLPPEAPKPLTPPKLGKPELSRAPLVWKSTRGILQTNIEELKKGVRAQYGTEHPDLLIEIEQGMGRLGKVLEHLDDSLADALDRANAAADKPNREAALKGARAILSRYVDYVSSEPMIALMDDNPFDVKTSLKEIIADSLDHLAKAMA
jgi:peptidoglycan hydrolase-like protein with peptidoglycan-binding domain